MEVIISSNSFGSHLHGGQYEASSDSGSFPAWCAEQTQYLQLGKPITYVVIDGTEAWGSQESAALDRLMSWAIGNGYPTTVYQNDAIQTDIWAILSGGTGEIDSSNSPITQHAMLLHNDLKQDLLMTQPIGEPNPLPLMLFGLAMVAIYKEIKP